MKLPAGILQKGLTRVTELKNSLIRELFNVMVMYNIHAVSSTIIVVLENHEK